MINQTQYELQVFNGTEQIDTVPPFSFIVAPYENDLNVSIDKSNASTVLVSPYQYVAFKRIKGVVSYQTGSTTFPGNTPVAGTINVGNTDIAVTNARGGSLTVAGAVDIGNSPAVTVTSGAVDANITNANLEISTVGSITETIKSQVQNANIVMTGAIYLGTQEVNVANLTPGSSQPVSIAGQLGLYDQITYLVYSAGSNLSSYALEPIAGGVFIIGGGGVPALSGPGNVQSGQWAINQTTWFNNQNSIGYTNPVNLVAPAISNYFWGNLVNIGSTTIASDTVAVYLFARIASAEIINPTSAPVYGQANSGGFGAATNINVTATLAPGATQTNQLTTPGGYITSMSFIVDDTGGISTDVLGSVITLSNGGEVFYTIQPVAAPGGSNMVFNIPVGNGIYDNGISVTFVALSGNSNTSYDSISGIIVKTSTLGQPVPAVIV